MYIIYKFIVLCVVLVILLLTGQQNLLATTIEEDYNSSSSNNYVPIYFNQSLVSMLNNNLTFLPTVTLSSLDKFDGISAANVPSPLPSSFTPDAASTGPLPLSSQPVTISTESSLNQESDNPKINYVKDALEAALKDIRNNELEITTVQEIFDSMEFVPVVRNDLDIARNMSAKLQTKLSQAKKILNEMCKFVTQKYQVTESAVNPCPSGSSGSKVSASAVHRSDILDKLLPISLPNNLTSTINDSDVLEQFFKEWTKKKKLSLNYRHHFFISEKNPEIKKCPEHFDDTQFYKTYLSAIRQKIVIIMLDAGATVTREQFDLSRKIANTLINLLDDDDLVQISYISGKIVTPERCQQNQSTTILVLGQHRNHYLRFVDDIPKSTERNTNHNLAFRTAFDWIRATVNESSEIPVVIFYITRNIYSRIETKQILETIAKEQKSLPYPALINTVNLVEDDDMYAEDLHSINYLRDISSQNYDSYNIKTNLNPKKFLFDFTQGQNIRISQVTPSISAKLIQSFRNFFIDKLISKRLTLGAPHVDPNSKNLLVSMSKVCDGRAGVFGIDLFLSDLAEDVTYFSRYRNSYAFIVDTMGRTVMHPSFPRPITIKEGQLAPMSDISVFETTPHFEEVRLQILSVESDNLTIHGIDDKLENFTVSYSWSRVADFYVVVVVSRFNSHFKSAVNLKNLSPHAHFVHNTENINMLYHLEVYPKFHNSNRFCRHFKQMATLDSGAIYLSATSFQSPFYYLQYNSNSKFNRNASLHNIQPFLTYIKDTTRLLANPGLTPEVRNDIAVLQKVSAVFKKKFESEDNLKNYIIRRYITTINGVMQMYPGTLMNTNFEPTRRNWFKRAMENPGKIVMTEPYLDLGGAGYIITISHTIFEGKANALHSHENDLPVAVVSIDFTHGWFFKLMLKSSNFCSETFVKCFIMDDRGYLISHPSILQPTSVFYNIRRPAEHITHKESYVANDILNHEVLIKKKLCANYLNQTIERFYQLNTSLEGILTNVVHSERTKYHITLISGTNAFVGIVNSSYDGDAFCPCSTVNRLCLNCNRMEQTECECPCECPIGDATFVCDAGGNGSLNRIDSCPTTSEKFYPIVISVAVSSHGGDSFAAGEGDEYDDTYEDEVVSAAEEEEFDLKPCININCDAYATQFGCLGVMGCNWCQIDVDGETPLTSSFCTTQISCYNGILGSMTPYGDGKIGPTLIDPIDPPVYSALGPVIGAIIALCLVVGFAMYCYKQNVDNSDTNEHFYINSFQENYGMPMSRLDFKDMCQHDDQNDMNGTGNQRLIHNSSTANSIITSEISPYRIATNYRRPNGDSDHGYSTMTPHEDSEHIGFNLAEPLIQSNQKRCSMSDSVSVNTSVSSPHNYHLNLIPIDRPKLSPALINQTMLPLSLPSNRHYEVAVDVHRNMEAS